MKAYSIFLVVLMVVNFGLMAYFDKKNLKKFFLSNIIGLFAYFSLTLYILVWGNLNFNASRCVPFVFILVVGIQFFIHCKFSYFKFSYFILYWTSCARTLGFLPKDNFGEGWAYLFIVCGYAMFVFLWFFFLKNYRKIYQKIIFLLLSLTFFFCFIDIVIFESIFFIVGFPLSPLFFVFFAIGEILLFVDICYQMLHKDSNPPPHSPKDS